MNAPTSDSAAIRQTLRVLKAAGVRPTFVEYGGEDGENVATASEQVTVAAVLAVDDAFLIVDLPESLQAGGVTTSHIRFVMGNDPDEVICDYGMSLEPVLAPLMDAWWS